MSFGRAVKRRAKGAIAPAIFLSLVAFIFWLGGLAEKASHGAAHAVRGVVVPPGVSVPGRGATPVTGD